MEKDDINRATIGYGLGKWYLLKGDTVKAYDIFKNVIDGNNWAAFGYIAAEAELANQ
jgi:hypothetical protein